MPVPSQFLAAVGAMSLAAGAAVATAAEPDSAGSSDPAVESGLIERPGDRLLRSIEADRELDRLQAQLSSLSEEAAAVGVEVGNAAPQNATVKQLEAEIESLRERLREARDANVIAGVPRSTLESIAACESGGDPTAVSADGTYRGKYQFDRSTWASVGGSGDPAAAPEAEQDYRAALLYSRTGSSAWPVCG